MKELLLIDRFNDIMIELDSDSKLPSEHTLIEHFLDESSTSKYLISVELALFFLASMLKIVNMTVSWLMEIGTSPAFLADWLQLAHSHLSSSMGEVTLMEL